MLMHGFYLKRNFITMPQAMSSASIESILLLKITLLQYRQESATGQFEFSEQVPLISKFFFSKAAWY